MRRALLAIASVAAGCGGDDVIEPPTLPTFTAFGIVNTKSAVRPWGCVQAELAWNADQPIAAEDIVWSSDDLFVMPYLYLETHAYATVCAHGQAGSFSYKVGLASLPDYYATGKLFVHNGDHDWLYRTHVPEVLGSSSSPPLRLQWASDGSAFFVSGKDRTLVKYDGTTGEYVTGWYTYSEQAALLDGDRVAISIDSDNVGIVNLANFGLETYYNDLGLTDFAISGPTVGGTEEVIAIGGAGTKVSSWEFKEGQNSGFCRIGVLDLAGSGGTPTTATPAGTSTAGMAAPDRYYVDHSDTSPEYPLDRLSQIGFNDGGPAWPSGQFVPDQYVEMSAGGRYLAFGYGGCRRGNVLYDTRDNRACKLLGGGYNGWQPHAEFSRDESTYAVPANGALDTITVFKTESCESLGGFATPFSPHRGLALSPDGRMLATAADFTDGTPGRTVRVILWDTRPENPGWANLDFNGTSQIGAYKVLYLNLEYDSGKAIPPSSFRLAFSPDGTKLAVAAPNGRVALLDVTQADGAPKYSLQQPLSETLLLSKLSPTTRYIWLEAENGDNGRGRWGIYDLDNKREVRRFNENIELDEIVLEDTTFAYVHDADAKWYRASYADPYTEVQLAEAPPPQPPPVQTNYGACAVVGTQLCNSVNNACIDVSGVLSVGSIDGTGPMIQASMISSTHCMVREFADVWTWNIGQPALDFQGRVAGGLERMAVHRLSTGELLFVGGGRLTRWRL